MEERIVLSFDVGTQSSRALLINNKGQVLGKVQRTHEPAYYSLEADWAEQEADFYFDHITAAARELKEKEAELWKQIEGVTLTTIRSTSVCVGKDGKPLRKAFVWLDKRKADGEPVIPTATKALLKAIGMEKAVKMQWKISPCNWMRQNEPENWEKTDKFLLLSGYLTYRLCGNMKDAVSSMVGYVPFDHKNRKWMKKGALTRFIFDIAPEKLCEVIEGGEILGTITKEAALATGLSEGLPLYAAGADKACETLGMGCITSEKAAISFGTTSTVTFTIDKYVEPEQFIPAYSAVMKGCYNPEIEIFRGYWLISWFKKEFAAKEVAQAKELGVAPEQLLNERLKEIPAGCEGLIFQPYFTPNLTMPVAKGAVIGFSDVHTRIHVYRAIIEGINFALMSGLRLMEKRASRKVKEIYLGGGGSQSDEICQITADMFGLPTIRTQTHEVAGIGSAMAAFVGLGVFADYDEAVKSMVRKKDVFQPDMEQHEIYEEIYEDIFSKVYDKLYPLYQKQREIVARRKEKPGNDKYF